MGTLRGVDFRQLRVAEESRYTHIKCLLNGAGDMDVPGDDTVMIHENSKEKNIHSLVTMMEVSTRGEGDT